MKKMTLFVFTSLLITACNKGGDGVAPAQLEHYPQTWILTIDQDPDEYVYLKTNGAVMYRDDVPRSYSLAELAKDDDCQWEVNTSRTEVGDKICFTIRLKNNMKIWLGAGPSSNKQEVHMHALNTQSTDPGDGYKWFIHKMPDVNGVKTVVLENVFYKDYYVSDAPPGWQFAQNLVTLQKEDDPKKGTNWQCR
jgi:hypothetical protein